ncbi:hypothetical protein RCL1_005633 [Eukaryota sp. TZLM3-RCL]
MSSSSVRELVIIPPCHYKLFYPEEAPKTQVSPICLVSIGAIDHPTLLLLAGENYSITLKCPADDVSLKGEDTKLYFLEQAPNSIELMPSSVGYSRLFRKIFECIQESPFQSHCSIEDLKMNLRIRLYKEHKALDTDKSDISITPTPLSPRLTPPTTPQKRLAGSANERPLKQSNSRAQLLVQAAQSSKASSSLFSSSSSTPRSTISNPISSPSKKFITEIKTETLSSPLGIRSPPRSRPLVRPPVTPMDTSSNGLLSDFGITIQSKTSGFIHSRNNCFLNSILSAICSLPAFRESLKIDYGKVGNSTDFELLSRIFDIITSFSQLRVKEISTDSVRSFLGKFKPEFSSGSQCDAHELLVTVLTLLDSEIRKKFNHIVNPGPIKSINDPFLSSLSHSCVATTFDFSFEEDLLCNSCAKIDHNVSVAREIQVLPGQGHSIEKMIDSVLNQNVERNCQYPGCLGSGAQLKVKFKSIPRILIVTLKRFDESGRKTCVPVDFSGSKLIDLSRFCSSSVLPILEISERLNRNLPIESIIEKAKPDITPLLPSPTHRLPGGGPHNYHQDRDRRHHHDDGWKGKRGGHHRRPFRTDRRSDKPKYQESSHFTRVYATPGKHKLPEEKNKECLSLLDELDRDDEEMFGNDSFDFSRPHFADRAIEKTEDIEQLYQRAPDVKKNRLQRALEPEKYDAPMYEPQEEEEEEVKRRWGGGKSKVEDVSPVVETKPPGLALVDPRAQARGAHSVPSVVEQKFETSYPQVPPQATPQVETTPSPRPPPRSLPPHYSLLAIVCHIGSALSGHYLTFINHGRKWVKYDDLIDVEDVDEGQVFKVASEHAYICFYQHSSFPTVN